MEAEDFLNKDGNQSRGRRETRKRNKMSHLGELIDYHPNYRIILREWEIGDKIHGNVRPGLLRNG